MRMQPRLPLSTIFASPSTKTAQLRTRLLRSLVVIVLTIVAAMAGATGASRSGSLGQLFFGSAGSTVNIPAEQPSEAFANTSFIASALPQGSASLNSARRGHTATRLADGRVLIAGGVNSGGGHLSEAEIFDSTAGTFSIVGFMALGRSDHAAVKLSDGRVLITGGRTTLGATSITEIFDPATGTFSPGPAMSVARAGHSATLLADGRVFIAGGNNNGSAEIFDPSSSTFSAVSANMNSARSMHSAALLLDGRVLLAGGHDDNGNPLTSLEVFDPAGPSFSVVADLELARELPHLRVLFDGKVQIIGGNNDESMEIYDPVSGEMGAYSHVLPATDTCTGLRPGILTSQTRAALFHNGQSDTLLDRSEHTINELSASNQALVAGGLNSSGIVLDSSSLLGSSPASITTDKLDYAPGETVNISGRGFQPGEIVRLKIHEDPHTPQERGLDVTADAEGNFVGEYLVQDYDLDMKFIVSARGLTSGWTAHTTFTDANNDAHVAPGWAATNTTVTFNTLYRKTTGGTVQHVRITLPVGYSNISVAATAFSSGTWSTPVVNQITRTVDVQLTAGTGLATNNVDWARIDVTATTPPANQSGNAAEWLMQTFTNTAGTLGEQNDNPPVLIGVITNPTATITFVDGSGNPIVSPVLQNGIAATVRVRITQSGSGIKYTDIAVPTCFSSPTAVSLSNPGGNPYTPPIVTDGFIRMSGGTIATNGSLTVTFTTTPNCTSGTYLVSSEPSTNASNPPSGTNQSVSTTGGSLTVAAGLADLSITKTDSPDPVAPNGNVTYTIGVSNAGPDDASAVKVVDTLPAGTTFVSATGTNWVCNNMSGTVTCDRTGGNLPASTSAPNITIVVTAPASGSITNSATVSSPNDNTPGNNTATATTNICAAPEVTCPAAKTASADASCQAAVPDFTTEATATGDCGPITKTQSPAAGTLVGLGPHTITVTATNSAGQTDTCTTTFTVEDNTAPTFTAPADTTIFKDASCAYNASVGVTGDVTNEADNCDSSLDATFTDVVAAGSCQGEEIITRTWSLTDDSGNNTTHVQVITAKDNTAPTFTAPANTTIFKDANCAFNADPSITGDVTDEADNCDTSLNATFTDVVAAGSCQGEEIITRTWSLTDDCGNNTTHVQVITAKDNTAPTFTAPADTTIFKDATCGYDASVGVTGDVTNEADNCDTSLDATFTDVVTPGSCEGEQIITRTWTLTDDCGNTATHPQVITARDNTAPTFTAPADTTIFKDASCSYDASVGVTGDVTNEADNCDTSLDATFTDVVAAGSCQGEEIITRTWSLTDDCGNNTTHVQVITAKDNTKPTFTAPANTTIFKDATCGYDASVAVTGDVTDEADNCDTSLNATFTDVVSAGTCQGEQIITRTWSLTDDCGNNTTHVQVIIAKDNTAPTFTAPANTTVFKDANCAFNADPSTTGDVTDEADNCDTSLNATFTDVTASGSCQGEEIITRTWSLTDDCGNNTTHVQVITAKDNMAPTFTAPADTTIFKDASCGYDASVGVTGDVTNEADNCDTSLEATFTDVVTAGSCQGETIITRTWTLTDDCGNTATHPQVITARDNTAPTFTAPPNTTVFKDANCAFNADPSTTGDVTDEADNCDTSLNATFTDVTASGSCQGEEIITRTWSLTDDCGNTTTHTQVITAKDNTAPTFTAPADTTVFKDATCTYNADPSITGDVTNEADNCDTSLNATYTDVTAAGSCQGEEIITRTWTLTDDCGNTATHPQVITARDNTAPTFTAPADTTIFKDASCGYDASVGVTGDVTNEADNCDTSLDATFTDVVTAGSCQGEQIITRTWTLTDDCGNTTTHPQVITAKDNTAPTFTAPADTTVFKDATCTYNADPSLTGDVTNEADNCDTSLNATYTDVVAVGSCEGEQIITRTWTLTDDCGNTATHPQVITAKDNTAPTFTAPAATTIFKDASCAYNADPSITGDVTDEADNCDTSLNATYTDVAAPGSCQGEQIITRTWSLTDDCGNTTTHTQVITAKDNTAPTFTAPADTTIFKDASCAYNADPSITGDVTNEADNCDTSLNATYTDVVTAGSCPGEEIITRTWSLTDDCGNTTTHGQVITAKDNTPPTLTVPQDKTVECPGSTDPSATGGATATDNCSSVTITYSDTFVAGPGGTGVITRTWKATDQCGNMTTGNQIITIVDTTNPVINLNSGPVATLWSPNHKYVNFKITDFVTSVTDSCNTTISMTNVYISKVTSDELENINSGDGNTLKDMVIANDCKSVDLRAERDGSKNGRVYTITFKVKDATGNVGTTTAKVTVPHSQGPKGTAIDDGPVYIVTNPNCP